MDGTLAQAHELTHRFLGLMRHHSGEGLDTWRKRVPRIREFLTFARSLERDKAAIGAGLTLPYSTGPVEGYSNRLKLDLSASICDHLNLLAKPMRCIQYNLLCLHGPVGGWRWTGGRS